MAAQWPHGAVAVMPREAWGVGQGPGARRGLCAKLESSPTPDNWGEAQGAATGRGSYSACRVRGKMSTQDPFLKN